MERYVLGLILGCLLMGSRGSMQLANGQVIPPQVLVSNQKVEMVRWILQPGEKTPEHTHRLDHIWVVVHGSRLKFVTSNGAIRIAEEKTGLAELVRADGVTHSFENVGTDKLEAISIDLK